MQIMKVKVFTVLNTHSSVVIASFAVFIGMLEFTILQKQKRQAAFIHKVALHLLDHLHEEQKPLLRHNLIGWHDLKDALAQCTQSATSDARCPVPNGAQ